MTRRKVVKRSVTKLSAIVSFKFHLQGESDTLDMQAERLKTQLAKQKIAWTSGLVCYDKSGVLTIYNVFTSTVVQTVDFKKHQIVSITQHGKEILVRTLVQPYSVFSVDMTTFKKKLRTQAPLYLDFDIVKSLDNNLIAVGVNGKLSIYNKNWKQQYIIQVHLVHDAVLLQDRNLCAIHGVNQKRTVTCWKKNQKIFSHQVPDAKYLIETTPNVLLTAYDKTLYFITKERVEKRSGKTQFKDYVIKVKDGTFLLRSQNSNEIYVYDGARFLFSIREEREDWSMPCLVAPGIIGWQNNSKIILYDVEKRLIVAKHDMRPTIECFIK
jgi:hypothetical protein